MHENLKLDRMIRVATWAPVWWKQRPRDVRLPDQTISVIGGRAHCNLCEQPLQVFGPEARAEHHHAHMLELDEWLTEQPAEVIKPDSGRRAEARRAQRAEALERAEALGEDTFRYAVTAVDPKTKHRRRTRRIRHPKAETETRIKELYEAGRMRAVIAETVGLSEDYVRRVLKRLEADGYLEKHAASPVSMRPRSDLAVRDDVLPVGGS